MQSIFNYNTLSVNLEKNTRTLFIQLNSGRHNYISMEMLFELESLLAWTSNKVEIHSIYFDSDKEFFSKGHNPEVLKDQTQNQIEKMAGKMQKIVQAMLHLPQTIIFDLGSGASNIGAELSVGADIRIASKDANINFDHAKLGLVPSSCGMSTLSVLIGQANTRNFLLTGQSIPKEQLTNTGFIYKLYTKDNHTLVKKELLLSINSQAPVQRIQTKLGIFENIREKVDHSMKIERQVSKAALMTEDWKKSNKTKTENSSEKKQADFMPSKSMSYSVKLSLVKDEPPLN